MPSGKTTFKKDEESIAIAEALKRNKPLRHASNGGFYVDLPDEKKETTHVEKKVKTRKVKR